MRLDFLNGEFLSVSDDDFRRNDVLGRDFEALGFRRGLCLDDGGFDDGVKELRGFTSGFLSVKCRDEKQWEVFGFHMCFGDRGSDADKKRARLDRISVTGTAKHPPEERAKPRRLGAVAFVFWKGRCKIRGFVTDPL